MTRLHTLFTAQRDYMSQLVSLGKLPEYPLVLGTREGQDAIKQIGGYFIEELAEAHEKYLGIWDYVNTNNSTAREVQVEYNEELADCLHFMLELLILANIDESAVMTFMEYSWSDYLPIDGEWDPWNSLMVQVRRLNMAAGINYNLPGKSRFVVSPNGIEMPSNRAGGRLIGLETIEASERMLWQITYCLKLAENLLKNKPWRENNKQVDFKDYHAKIVYTFFNFLAYCEAMGCTADSLFDMYFYKHEIIFQRIKAKY